MFTFLSIITAIVFIWLVMVASVRPRRSTLSLFELERRSKTGDKVAGGELKREQSVDDIVSLLQVKTALLLVAFVLLSVVTFGWLIGIVIAVIVALGYGAIAKIKFVGRISQKIYDSVEPKLLALAQKMPRTMKLLRSYIEPGNHGGKIDSRQELQHLVEQSTGVLSDDEKKLIASGLSFHTTSVGSIMTPRSVIDSIKKSEFLGPLTLNDLHKTGHSRLPVIDGDIDHIVGILHLKSLLALDIKRSTTAEKAMDPKVYYVREDQTLQHALAAFLRTHHHLFVVVNEYRETVGLLALEDVIEALIGHKIIDEFDAHDDLRAVALRNPSGNNEPQKAQNI